MAKIVPTNVKIKGKLGDEVYVDSRAYGHHVRKVQRPGLRKDEPAFKAQHSRTIFLNALASALNREITKRYERFKGKDFYARLQKRFRKEPLDNRFLLLWQLKGMEICNAYPLTNLGNCILMLKGTTKEIIVNMQVNFHPQPGKYKANCYYNELLLFTWGKGKEPAIVQRQLSDWVYLKDKLPEFEFVFPKPAGARQWLLCLRQRLAVDTREVEAFVAEGIQFAEVGSFDKKDLALLDTRNKEKAEQRLRDRIRVKEEEEVRVKAKG